MTTMPSGAPTSEVPQWDVCDRLRKALRQADVGVIEMANYLDVSRNTVGNWLNGRVPPSTQTLRVWAMRTGVPFGWLAGGDDYDRNDTDVTRPKCLCYSDARVILGPWSTPISRDSAA